MTSSQKAQNESWLEPLLNPPGLDFLCQEPDLTNEEIFKSNHYYGNAAVLKRYAGWPQNQPVKGILQHGIYLYPGDFTAGGELEAVLPLFLPISEERAEVYRRLSGGRPAIPIGSSFLYAKALVEEALPAVEKSGTLVFLSHSTRQVTKIFDHAAYAERLARLPESFHPIVISAYWKDYLDGQYAPYVARGFELVTAGHMMDPNFLYRFYLNCRRFQYACSNDIGTHLFFAVESGCSFFVLPGGEIEWKSNKAQHLQGYAEHEQISREVQALFSEPSPYVTEMQQTFVNDKLGKACFKSPQALRKLLEYAENQDKFCLLPPQKNGRLNIIRRLPPFWQRMRPISKFASWF